MLVADFRQCCLTQIYVCWKGRPSLLRYAARTMEPKKFRKRLFKFLYTFNFTWFFITSINLIFNAKVRLDPKTYSEIVSVTEFICDFIKNLAPLCDATDEHRVVMAFPVVVIYQKGSDDITICGKGNYKSLILRLKSFYGFYNKNFYTSQRKNLNQVCHLNSWCHLNLLSPSLTTYIHHAIARLSLTKWHKSWMPQRL